MKENLGKYNLPVILYIRVIGLMFFTAWNRFIYIENGGDIIFCGAVLFFLSDAALGFNKFRTPCFSQNELLIYEPTGKL